MSVLIVGGDHLGSIEGKLKEAGFEEIFHVSGRKKQTLKTIPENVNSILVLTDYVNHNLSREMKVKAKKRKVPIYFARRSWTSIYHALNKKE